MPKPSGAAQDFNTPAVAAAENSRTQALKPCDGRGALLGRRRGCRKKPCQRSRPPPVSNYQRGSTILYLLAGYLVCLVPLNWLLFRLLGRNRVRLAGRSATGGLIGVAVVTRVASLDIGFAWRTTELSILELRQLSAWTSDAVHRGCILRSRPTTP
ncbi:MAG: hypothetical protein R3C56_25125 [Pirellulaceae bacterium]